MEAPTFEMPESYTLPTMAPTKYEVDPQNTNPAGVDLFASDAPTAQTSEVDVQKETTAGQLLDLLDSSNPYLTQARERGIKYAASRGLQNSSIAGQASEQSAIAAALPIASETAATHERRALTNQEAENTFRLQRAGFEQNAALTAIQHAQTLAQQAEAGNIQSKHLFEQFGFSSQLSAQENVQRLQQQAQAGNIEAKLQLAQFNYQTILSDQSQGHALQLEDKRLQGQLTVLAEQYANARGLNEQDTQLWIERQNLAHQQTLEQIKAQATETSSAEAQQAMRNLQSQYLASVSQRQAMTSQEIMSIYQTQGLTPAQQTNAVNTAISRLNADIASLQAQYAESPLWDKSWGAYSSSPSSPSPYVPTSTKGESAVAPKDFSGWEMGLSDPNYWTYQNWGY